MQNLQDIFWPQGHLLNQDVYYWFQKVSTPHFEVPLNTLLSESPFSREHRNWWAPQLQSFPLHSPTPAASDRTLLEVPTSDFNQQLSQKWNSIIVLYLYKWSSQLYHYKFQLCTVIHWKNLSHKVILIYFNDKNGYPRQLCGGTHSHLGGCDQKHHFPPGVGWLGDPGTPPEGDAGCWWGGLPSVVPHCPLKCMARGVMGPCDVRIFIRT